LRISFGLDFDASKIGHGLDKTPSEIDMLNKIVYSLTAVSKLEKLSKLSPSLVIIFTQKAGATWTMPVPSSPN
jgi:hypothetical protein